MEIIREEIEEIVNRETKAWDTQDVKLLLTIFHPEIVWPWPRTSKSHDPMDWVLEIGKYDYDRWNREWQELFDKYTLVHNKKEINKIEISAVVDIDTLWMDFNNNKNHWKGRVCKVYTKVKDRWKLIMHTGVLEY